ncbi:MAG: radical SAM protein, partial [Candidatus Eisenbacteria sp.]|nr:radical SAM protein [Candidatus Eisenbacteria bacterium]
MDRFQFAIAVLGCRTNQDEFDALRSVLLGMGGEEVGFPGPADLVLVNSCAVTASAQAKSRKEIRKAGRIKQGGFLIVTGCAAQADPAGLARLEGVDLVLGNRAKTNLPHILKRVLSGEGLAKERAESSRSGAALISWEADATVERFISRSGPIPARRSRPTLKIQDGCPFRCSFCIVPHLRGDPRSRDPGEVLREARRLAEAGMHEIVLTGIN